MSLDKKDTKIYLEPGVHAALAKVAEIRGVGIYEAASAIVTEEVLRLVHEASLLADVGVRAGIVRNTAETAGISRNGAESSGRARK